MTTALVDEDVDLMACGVCFHRYDLEDKKPKFLQCSHSLCLPCVKEILKDGRICCPFCRNTFPSANADSIPNNNYATQILILMKKTNEETSAETAQRTLTLLKWCPVCQAAESSLCEVSGHSTINITSECVKNMEVMTQARTDLVKLKDLCTDTLAQITQNRRTIQEQFIISMSSFQFVEEEVKKLQDEIDLVLGKIMSIL